jgi:hypothetical protein
MKVPRPPAPGNDASRRSDSALVPGSGRRVDDEARGFLEPRLGFDLRNVRVFSGAEAAASARALGARAYALGPNVVFGAGQYAPSTPEGLRLLAHELAHVIQDGTGSVIHRQPAAVRTWDQIWNEFDAARSANPALATTLASELASTTPGADDLVKHGMELVDWLQSHGSPAAALRVLGDVRKAFKSGKTAAGKPIDPFDVAKQFFPGMDPEILIARGKSAARAGDHDQAFQLLGAANEILWGYVQQLSQGKNFGGPEILTYPELGSLYGRLREIYAIYPELEQAAIAAGDTRHAREAGQHGEELRSLLAKDFTPTGEAELAEFQKVSTSRGDALRLMGANNETTDLTMLPGLESPGEVVDKGGGGTQVDPISTVQTALMGQVDLQAELAREPAIRKAFPKGGPIDLNETGERLKAWGAMYEAYKSSSNDPLGSLMTLIGKYLKAYTHHTTYNIRDFGENYITSRFPVNAAGQAERDCGVYALMVAWDVFETVKHGSADLDVAFRLDVMLDHIILVIDDKSTLKTYIVSNDKITTVEPVLLRHPRVREAYDEPDLSYRQGPYVKQNPEEKVSEEYANVRNLAFLVSPEIPADLGSTKTGEAAFRKNIWAEYLAKTAHATDVSNAVNDQLARISAEQQGGQGMLSNVFEAQKAVNDTLVILNQRVDEMEKLNPAEMAQRVDGEFVEAFKILMTFGMIAHSDKGPTPKHPVMAGMGGGVHPLVRYAQLLLQVGGVSTTFPIVKAGRKESLDWNDFVKRCRAIFQAP